MFLSEGQGGSGQQVGGYTIQFRVNEKFSQTPFIHLTMAISYHPRAGQVLICDFAGFRLPEMVKTRPVIVISPRLPQRSEIVTVVPISLTGPRHDLPFVIRLSRNYHSGEDNDLPCWAKCDLVLNIGLWRLDGFKVGRRKWESPQISGEDLTSVRKGVLFGLGMDHLLEG
jgi:mRNA interferase MazF